MDAQTESSNAESNRRASRRSRRYFRSTTTSVVVVGDVDRVGVVIEFKHKIVVEKTIKKALIIDKVGK